MNQSMVNGIMRAVLAAVGGMLGAKGVSDSEAWAQVSGAIIVLVTAAWSLIEKKKITLPPSAGMIIGMALTGGLLMTSGCATSANDVAMAKIAADTASNYYSQPKNATYMEFEGSNVTFAISGASRLVFSGPIPPKSIYPREEGTLKQVMDGAGNLAKTVALGAVGIQGVKALKAQAPTVVTTEKLVPVAGSRKWSATRSLMPFITMGMNGSSSIGSSRH